MIFIGKFENLQSDFNKICEIIGIKKEKLPLINNTNKEDYKSYYTEETKKIIQKAYKKDIEMFNYSF